MDEFAIAVSFNRQIEPYSEEEGVVPGRVEDVGFERGGTVISPDRKTIYVTIHDDPNEVTSQGLEDLLERLTEGFDPPSWIHGDIAAFSKPILQYEGPSGEPVRGITEVKYVTIDTDEMYHSAAIAIKEE